MQPAGRGDPLWPDFIGIGVPKAGSTWIYQLLRSHPAIWVPPQRTEVHFFDRHYDRGFPWYQQFFPPGTQRDRYRAVGEYTPSYLYHARSVDRIHALPSVTRLLVSLRNPVTRAFSYYQFRIRIDNYRGTFEQFLVDRPYTIEWGYYGKYLRPFVETFGRAQLLALLFENAVADVDHTKRCLADFLGVDPGGFREMGRQRVNPSYRPRHPHLYAAAFALGRWMRERDMYRAMQWATRLGLKKWVSRGATTSLPDAMLPETRRRLVECYADDIDAVERLLGVDLSVWRVANA